jgi:type III pantothenate kinase
MLLAVDVGNTNIVLALFDGDKVVAQWRLATRVDRTVDEFALSILQLLQLHGFSQSDVTDAIMSSVVPSLMFPLARCIRQYFNAELIIVGDAGVEIGINVKLDRPQEAGADRVVNAYAAREKYGANVIVLDFGTATTFDVVDGNGDYIGGVIAPGVNLSVDALHAAAAKLPRVAVVRPDKVLGTNTIGAMQSGIYYGYVGLVEGIVSRLCDETAAKMTVIATGGLAPLFARATPAIHHLDADLTIRGLWQIHKLNRK